MKSLRTTLLILLVLTWQQRLAVAQVTTPTNTFSAIASAGLSLQTWFSQLSSVYTQPVGVRIFADSISSCWQTDPGCSTYGPQFSGNRWPNLLVNAATQAGFPIFGSGIQPCIGTVITAAFLLQGPYTSTGTIANGNAVGPSQTAGALTGGSICQMTAGATITFPASTAFYAARFYCGETSSNNTIAVTIGGTSVGNICGTTTGTTVAAAQTILNPGGTTSAAIVLTASGTGLFYGLELQYTSKNYGLVIHNEGVGAANSYFFGANNSQNLAFSDQFFGSHALAIVSLGVNDQAGAVAPATFQSNINYVLNHEQSFGSSTMIANEYVWTGTGSTNTSLRPTNLAISQSLANPAPSDYVDLQDMYGPITPAQACTMGLLQCSDLTHETDLGSLAMAQAISQHLFLGRLSPVGGFSFGTNQTQGGYTSGYEALQNSTDANPNFRIQGCFYTSLVTCNIDHGSTSSGNWFWGINGATAQTNIGGNGGVLSIGSYYIALAAANAQTPASYPVTIDYTNKYHTRPYNVVVLGANNTGSAYTNATSAFTTIGDGTHNMSFVVNASETTSYSCRIIYSASATTVGIAFQWTYSGSVNSFASTLTYNATLATAINSNIANVATAVSTQQPTTPTVVNAASTNYVAYFDVDLNANATGTLALQAKNSAAGTVTVALGSRCERK